MRKTIFSTAPLVTATALLMCGLTLPAQAGDGRNFANAGGFICAPKILPSTAFKPGTIFYTKTDFMIPDKTNTDTYDVVFSQEYLNPDGSPAITPATAYRFRDYAGMSYKYTTNVGAGLELVANEQKLGDYKARAKAKGRLGKTVTVVQTLPAHMGYAMTDRDLEPIMAWWKNSDIPKRAEYKGKAFYVVREIRFSDRLTYNVDKKSLATMGVDVSVDGIGSINADATMDHKGNFSLEEKYKLPLIFCYRAQRLNPIW